MGRLRPDGILAADTEDDRAATQLRDAVVGGEQHPTLDVEAASVGGGAEGLVLGCAEELWHVLHDERPSA